jgi:hypothetical protein
MEINTKAEFFRMWHQGLLGNRTRLTQNPQEAWDWGVEDYGFRRAQRGGGGGPWLGVRRPLLGCLSVWTVLKETSSTTFTSMIAFLTRIRQFKAKSAELIVASRDTLVLVCFLCGSRWLKAFSNPDHRLRLSYCSTLTWTHRPEMTLMQSSTYSRTLPSSSPVSSVRLEC